MPIITKECTPRGIHAIPPMRLRVSEALPSDVTALNSLSDTYALSKGHNMHSSNKTCDCTKNTHTYCNIGVSGFPVCPISSLGARDLGSGHGWTGSPSSSDSGRMDDGLYKGMKVPQRALCNKILSWSPAQHATHNG